MRPVEQFLQIPLPGTSDNIKIIIAKELTYVALSQA